MDDKLLEKMEEKIEETFSKIDEVKEITNLLGELPSDKKSFAYGIVIGRLYNSFYYQCRRILNRNPTESEFNEFIKILKNKQKEFLEKTL